MQKTHILVFMIFLSLFLFAQSDKGKKIEPPTKVIFEPHGENMCASGCAASRHPTPPLSDSRFEELIDSYALEPMTEDSKALEELLFFGSQTEFRLEELTSERLDKKRLEFLKSELKRSKVRMEFRIIDDEDTVRVALDPTEVPFDRRYVFEPLKTQNFQPPEASGTVKRVGLRHIWQRI